MPTSFVWQKQTQRWSRVVFQSCCGCCGCVVVAAPGAAEVQPTPVASPACSGHHCCCDHHHQSSSLPCAGVPSASK
eukprot:3758092-Amphidinium_carterae.1